MWLVGDWVVIAAAADTVLGGATGQKIERRGDGGQGADGNETGLHAWEDVGCCVVMEAETRVIRKGDFSRSFRGRDASPRHSLLFLDCQRRHLDELTEKSRRQENRECLGVHPYLNRVQSKDLPSYPKLQLGNALVREAPASPSQGSQGKQELAEQVGSQAGAWEPGQKRECLGEAFLLRVPTRFQRCLSRREELA